MIFLSSYGQDIGAIIRALREVGYDAPVMGGDAYDDPAMHEALGEKLGNDVFFVTHTWMGPEAHPDMPKFIDLYTKMHGAAPDTSFVATGWDTVMMMAEAVKAAGSTDGAAVAKALEDGEFKLLTGDLNYGTAEEGHAPNKAAVMIELKGGKPTFLGWRRPESVPAPESPRRRVSSRPAPALADPLMSDKSLNAAGVSVEFPGFAHSTVFR